MHVWVVKLEEPAGLMTRKEGCSPVVVACKSSGMGLQGPGSGRNQQWMFSGGSRLCLSSLTSAPSLLQILWKKFRWIDGSCWNYSNWASAKGSGRCVAMRTKGEMDGPQDKKKPYPLPLATVLAHSPKTHTSSEWGSQTAWRRTLDKEGAGLPLSVEGAAWRILCCL